MEVEFRIAWQGLAFQPVTHNNHISVNLNSHSGACLLLPPLSELVKISEIRTQLFSIIVKHFFKDGQNSGGQSDDKELKVHTNSECEGLE